MYIELCVSSRLFSRLRCFSLTTLLLVIVQLHCTRTARRNFTCSFPQKWREGLMIEDYSWSSGSVIPSIFISLCPWYAVLITGFLVDADWRHLSQELQGNKSNCFSTVTDFHHPIVVISFAILVCCYITSWLGLGISTIYKTCDRYGCPWEVNPTKFVIHCEKPS